MDPIFDPLLQRLTIGPAFLLVGQASLFWSDDPGPSTIPPLGAGPAALGACADEIAAAAAPEALGKIADFPWNGVFTSRFDPSFEKAFRASWRRVSPISSGQVGRNSRSPTELQIRHLFGAVFLPPDERPPADEDAVIDAEEQANDILTALSDPLLTPRGVVVIDGYDLGDWLSTRRLYTLLNRLGSNQAYLFDASAGLLADRIVRRAIDNQKLVVSDRPFAWFLEEAQAAGRLDKSSAGGGQDGRRLIRAGDRFVELDPSIWNQVIGTARPVDTTLLEPFGPASPAITYQRFRDFIGASEGSPPFKAVSSGFKFRRTFEDALHRTVDRALKKDLGSPDPIIVAGQTATGKSLALCDLALTVARSGQAAVLHQARRGERPSLGEVDAFAGWAEDFAELPVLMVWDGMNDDDAYYTLQRQLYSRGRRVLVVGSTYRTGPKAQRRHVAEATLDAAEIGHLRDWLQKFDIGIKDPEKEDIDASFLALLYRRIPDTHLGIRRGLVREARNVERLLEQLARTGNGPRRLTAVAHALKEAGYNIAELKPSDRPDADVTGLEFHDRSTAEQLTAVILVAGRAGLLVPLELVLRIIGREGWDELVQLVTKSDLFRWEENESGDQTLGARTTLEAQILSQEDLSLDAEVSVIYEMIKHLAPKPTRLGGPEVEFIVDLIEKVGPKSESTQYRRFFLKFANAFRELRTSLGGESHHRLVLQEANLTREYVLWTQGAKKDDGLDHVAMLHETEQLLERTIEEADAPRRSKLNLLVELASTAGAQLFEHTRGSAEQIDRSQITGLMDSVTRAALKARKIDPENFYPVDVVAWATTRAVNKGGLSDRIKVDLLAGVVASLDSVDPDALPPGQLARYQKQQHDVRRLLGDDVLAEEHLEEMRKSSDPAAYFFLARAQAQKGPEGEQEALDHLLAAPQQVRSDWRCARLLLDLFWKLRTGSDRRFLRGEREVLAFTQNDWAECLRVAESIVSPTSFDAYRLAFLQGLAYFHLGQYKRSKAIFEQLDADSAELSSRVVSTYLASTPDGQAASYTGRVTWVSPDGKRGRVWIDDLGTDINFIPRRFSSGEVPRKNELLPTFRIAFNMRGALADPIRAQQRPEKRAAGEK